MSDPIRVVIIGGGILGCSAAYSLSKKLNCQTTLLEANTLASGTTSYAAALLTRARQHPVIADLVRQTFHCIHELEELLGQQLPYNPVGSLHLATQAESHQQVQQMALIAKQQNLDVEWLNAQQAMEQCPWLRLPSDALAAYMPNDGFIDPYQLAMAYAQGAKKLSDRHHCSDSGHTGLTIRQGCRVKTVLQQGDRVTGVELTDGEKVFADVVIDAAGPWSTLLARQVGVNLAMAPVRSHYWLTGKLASVPSDSPMVILPDARAYARPEVGHLLFGLRDYHPVYTQPENIPDDLAGFSFGEDSQGWDTLEEGFDGLSGFFPELHSTSIEHYISSVSSYTSDGYPLVGYLTDSQGNIQLDGFIAMTGCSGGGIGMSGGLGRLVAELVDKQTPYTDLKPLSLHRFGEIDPLQDDFQRECALARCGKRGG